MVHFAPEHVRAETVFESPRLWSQILCFDRNQQMGPVEDAESDSVVLIVAGRAVVQVDSRRKRVDQWGTVLVPARSQLAITNASEDPLVVLLVAAPPPAPRAVTG